MNEHSDRDRTEPPDHRDERFLRYAEAVLVAAYVSTAVGARAAIDVADAEQAELRAEVERLRGTLDVLQLELDATTRDAEAAEAKVARVEALAREWESWRGASSPLDPADDLRRALNGPTTAS